MFGPPKPMSEIMFNKASSLTQQRSEESHQSSNEPSSPFDTDKSGRISSKEFSRLCFNLGYALTDTELELALKILDDDNSGSIELQEFTNWWKREDRWTSIQLQGEELERRHVAAELFNSYDAEHTGYIGKQDFGKLYADLKAKGLTKQTEDKALENMDRSGDGKLQFSEYITWMRESGIFSAALPQRA